MNELTDSWGFLVVGVLAWLGVCAPVLLICWDVIQRFDK